MVQEIPPAMVPGATKTILVSDTNTIAADVVTATTLAVAVTLAAPGDVIEMGTDEALTTTAMFTTAGSPYTLNLGSFEIASTGAGTRFTLIVKDGVTLNIEGADGTLTNGNSYSAMSNSAAIDNEGTVNIKSGTIQTKSGNGTDYAIFNDSDGTNPTINISGGIVQTLGGSVNTCYAIYNTKGAVNISGGTVQTTGGDCPAIRNNSSRTVNITGGIVQTTGSASAIDNNGTIAVSGGRVLANSSTANTTAITLTSNGCTLNQTGGVIEAIPTDNYAIYVNNTSGVNINISGGMVVAATGQSIKSDSTNKAIIKVSGGSITDRDINYPTSAMTNTGGTPVFLHVLTVGTPTEVSNTNVSDFTPTPYGTKDVKTNDDGKIYVWLPTNGPATVTLKADGKSYKGTTAIDGQDTNLRNKYAATLEESAPPKPDPGGGGTATTNLPPQMESTVGHYTVIVNGNTTWNGNGNLTMKIDAPYDDFYAVEVNGVTIAPDHYTATKGSTVVTFKESYLKKLPAGTHTVRFLFTSGVAQTNLIIKGAGATGGVADNPKTGDESNMALYGVLIVLSLGVLLVMGKRVVRNRE